MSGLVKAKKYDWKDSNLALFGSDTEKNVKKSSAETEPAWKGAGQKVGIRIWRIVKFKVTDWPKDDYGKFYNGDSYIILNTYKEKESDELLYDVHFWIGQYSTQDEYGTAAYKTVELDTLLDDKPIQHREVMDHESSLFKSYFDSFSLLEGGADTGFRHVKPTEYQPRLLHFCKTVSKKVEIKEVPLFKQCLDSSDVFILDLGLEIFQWNGKTCNKDEKFTAVQFLQTLKSERSGKPVVESLDERDISESHKFYSSLTDGEKPEARTAPAATEKILYKLSDESGNLEFTTIATGQFQKSMLDRQDVYIIDTGSELFVWVGSGASPDEKKNGMTYAHNYLMKTDHPLIPVTVVKEGQESAAFNKAFSS
ncbi:gelsolin-like protein 1 [Antedon mediterranea]|uniref:gelsolin-like protein 1 n=1 Tax=Antedon mediterranea TaxID=105859 RepID=UPI003AF56F89